ncbi:hypothetical protein HanIR_Chr16g0814411 [Helianthus annuus]|nr:hypothetical protein HanIR_Chr16g0814411 [Helianthus annuus]
MGIEGMVLISGNICMNCNKIQGMVFNIWIHCMVIQGMVFNIWKHLYGDSRHGV